MLAVVGNSLGDPVGAGVFEVVHRRNRRIPRRPVAGCTTVPLNQPLRPDQLQPEGSGAITEGGYRLANIPDNETAEFAVIVRDDMTGKGLGEMLMRRIIDYARDRRIGELYGDVLSGNDTMLALCRRLGFAVSQGPATGTARVTLRL